MANNSIEMNIELAGYDKIKEQLNDIENQIDRIIAKSQKIGQHESMEDFLKRTVLSRS